MALNSSGPISLAGSNVGESIALEIGRSPTATVEMTEALVRSLAGVPSGQIVVPNDFWGKALPFSQQGSKLSQGLFLSFGYSTALSADGNTLAIGAPTSSGNNGAVYVYTRSGSTWTQQGSALVGTGNTGAAFQGVSVALSSDGDTLAIGGNNDNSGLGAVWVFTRTAGVWTQQGSKLVGTGSVGATVQQGISVDLSSDGNTLAIGGTSDNSNTGAAWVFTRTGGVWTQEGSKLVGTGSTGAARQGLSVALSSDGNTLAMGGTADNSSVGAVWVFTRTGGSWSQQGSKLVGTGNTGTAEQGFSVSLSSDGNTLASGGRLDNSNVGATWVFTRSGSTWTQQGSKLVGTGAVGLSQQGSSVSLSGDGKTLAVGGPIENSNVGATWIFILSSGVWSQQGSKLVGTGYTSTGRQGVSVSLSTDGFTLAVGGNNDNSLGATWIFIKT